MKANAMKYIFFTLVILMITLAVYFLYKDSNQKVYAVENNEVKIDIIKDLNIAISEYDTINPILSNNRDIQYIDKLIFKPLIDIDFEFKTQYQLAEEFSKINDTNYILKLKDDIYWHDGKKVNIEDVIFTINNLKNDNINSIYKNNVKEIKELQKIDDYTLKIVLNNKVDFFEYMMCIPILASHAYHEDTLESKISIPIGTGDFKITKIEDGNILIEKCNFESASKITKIKLILKETTKELYLALIKNEIDFMITDNIEYEDYVGTLGYNVNTCCYREFEYLILNNENKILKDKEVRKVINYVIDKNEINYNVYNNKYKIAEFPLDYGSYLYESMDKTKYDINQARDVLLENGWTFKNNIWIKNGRTLKLRLLVNIENEKRVQLAEKIKQKLNEFGIIIDIIAVNNNAFNNYIKYKNYDMVLTGNIVSNNPNLETYFGDDNLSNYKNVEVNSILREIKNIDNQEKLLKEKYQELRDIYEEEVPFISLYFNNLFILSNKNLKGDLQGNWYNVFYNIENWYKVEED